MDSSRATLAEEMKINVISDTPEADIQKQLEEISRSFVSDTLTVPTKEMYLYAAQATIGDDVYTEPSTRLLEEHVARLAGKEAGLFLASGTMSNQIALRTHLKQPPYSVLCDYRAHVHKYECGGIGFHSSASVIPVAPVNGHHLTLEDVENAVIIGTDVHYAPTEVIALENTLNGTIIPQDEVEAISRFAHSKGIIMHLDGARIWHVVAEIGVSLKTLAEPFDSVSLCFSKGLGAPVGSVLVGSKTFIAKARWFRKLFGGGMRQTGILAASAAYALTYNFPKLAGVHQLAAKLEEGLRKLGATILCPAETCMVFYDPSPLGTSFEEIAERAALLPKPIALGGSRLVIHIQTSPQVVDDFLSLLGVLAEEKKAAGWVVPVEAIVPKDVHIRRR